MDYFDAITEVLEKAQTIRLPPQRVDVVPIARREFAKHGSCDAKFIDLLKKRSRIACEAGRWSKSEKSG